MLFTRVFLVLALVTISGLASPITKHELPSSFTDVLRRLVAGFGAVGVEVIQFLGNPEVDQDSATVNGIVVALGDVQTAFEGLADQLLDGEQPTFTPLELVEAHDLFDQLADESRVIGQMSFVKEKLTAFGESESLISKVHTALSNASPCHIWTPPVRKRLGKWFEVASSKADEVVLDLETAFSRAEDAFAYHAAAWSAEDSEARRFRRGGLASRIRC